MRQYKFMSLSILLFFLVMLGHFLYFSLYTRHFFDIKCVAHFTVARNELNTNMTVTSVLTLKPDFTGRMQMSGSVTTNRNIQAVLRFVEFDYEIDSEEVLKLNNFRLSKYAGDSMDESFFHEEIIDLGPDKTHFFTLERVNDLIIIGNGHSPVFICVKNN